MSFEIAHDTHDALLSNLERALKDILNIEVGDRELRVVSIDLPRTARKDDLKAQKGAKVSGSSHTAPIKGTLELREGGKVINRATVKLVDVPQVTVRGTYIVGGNEYSVPLQKRLIPGVYTKEHNDGKISAWMNSSKGRNMTISLRPEGDFIIELEGLIINLFAVLLGLGVREPAMRTAWGQEVYDKNKVSRGSRDVLGALKKVYGKLHYKGDPELTGTGTEAYAKWITDYFKERSSFNAENVELTLGQKFSHTSAKMFLAITQKILSVSRGDSDGDNKESLIHNEIYDLSDFVIERLGQRQYQSRIQRALTRNIARYDKVSEIVQKDIFQTPLESTFTQTNLAKIPKQTNPMDQVATFSEITVMGEGGIQSAHAITDDVRAIDPSHMGFLDPAHTPEGSNVGTTVHLAVRTRKVGKNLVSVFYDVKTGARAELTPREAYGSYITFPEFYKNGKLKPESDGLVKVSYRGEMMRVKPTKVQYSLTSATSLVGVNTMAIPFLSHNNGTRVMTASKMQAQAKPLKHREAPIVKSAISESSDLTIEDMVGKMSLPRSPVDGVVSSVKDDEVGIKDAAGKVHTVGIPKDLWLNENNYTDVELSVKVGDKVKKGQPLGDTNYTKGGSLALGTNLRVAYVPYKGYNHEDGVVISEAAAERLTSLHAYQEILPFQDNEILDKKQYVAYFPAAFTQEQLSNLDETGLVKEGVKLKKGDPIMVKMRKVEEDALSKKLQNISRLLTQDFRDTSITWEKSTQGSVSEVHRRSKDMMVVVKTEERAKLGDKIVGRYGNKGTITTILPDKEMPQDEEGNPMELLIDPSGVPGRMNIGQIMETTASKVADADGKSYVAKPFGGDYADKILKELKGRGLKDHGTLRDGDKEIKGVLYGKQYIFKMEHQVEKKLSARGAGPGYSYSSHGQPSRGGGQSGRAVGLGELYALLSHGADANLAEMYTFKGDKQLEVWRAVENGTMIPPPQMPASSERFVNMLRGMGIDLVEGDDMVKMVPFLDKDVKSVSSGKIREATALRAKDLKEEKGGLFDFKTTGGMVGDKWAHVDLAEPMPHPTFEKSILAVTRLKKQDLSDIMSGKKAVLNGKLVKGDSSGAIHGGEAVKSLLKKVDPDARIKELMDLAPKQKGSELNKSHMELRVLKNFRDNKIKLEDMVVSTMPVIPPKFRPVTEMPNGDLAIADVNEHYRATIMMNNQLSDLKDRPGLIDEAMKARASLYESLSGVMGKSQGLVEKEDVKGLSRTISGTTPKTGYFQSRVLKRRQDVSGTAVIGPEPKLKLDEIGVPENMAWEIFRPFVVKDLKANGLTSMAARKEVDDRSKFAKNSLLNVMEGRHVLANRAPTLHKGSFMAFKPKITPGSAIRLSVENYSGFNADNDGDTFGIHVPVTEKANREAESMLPSNNLFSAGRYREKAAPTIGKEYMMGIWKLTRNGKTTSKNYITPELAIKDAMQRKIKWDDIISVKRIGRTTAGKCRIMSKVPKALQNYQATLTEKEQEKLLVRIAREGSKQDYLAVLEDWKHAGRIHVYDTGTSLLLSDLQSLKKERLALYRTADQQAAKIRNNSKLSKKEKDRQLVEIYSKVDSKIIGMAVKLPPNSAGQSNNISDMVQSGMSKPGVTQLKQLVGSVGLMLDHRQNIMPEPVRGNYAEGLSSSEFFSHMYSQRKGMIDKSQSVRGPGMLSKELTNTAATQKITAVDCGTTDGRMENVDRNLLDRVLATPAAGISAGSVIDNDALSKLQKANVPKVRARSILSCRASSGICAKCFGLDEYGKFPAIGQNVGVSEIQAITERSVQLPMKTFHTGGVASSSAANQSSAFDRALQIFRMPETIRNKAVLSEVSGVVSSIRKSGYGGSVIVVGTKEHKAPKNIEVKVKVGDQVKKGDVLTTGTVKPQELMKLRGVEAMQDQMCSDLHDAFTSVGVKLHKRTYEVPVKMLTEQVRVSDPGECKDFVPGDYSTVGKVNSWNRSNPTKRQIKYTNITPGSLYAPQYTEDFARRMALGRIRNTLEEGAGMGFATNRKADSPFLDLALGPGAKIKPVGTK